MKEREFTAYTCGVQVWMCFGISLQKQSFRTELLPCRSQWRSDLHRHLSFKTAVSESHLIISPGRIHNFSRLDYSTAGFVKSHLMWILWILIPPEMRVAVICSWLRWVHGGATGFLNDNVVVHLCHAIAVALKHFRLLSCSGGPITQWIEDMQSENEYFISC